MKDMVSENGKILSGGIAVGTLRIPADECLFSNAGAPRASGNENERLGAALSAVSAELSLLEADTARHDADAAAIFGIHRMMLEDPDYTDLMDASLGAGASAEDAVREAERTLTEMFESSGDEILAARSADIRDVTRRLLLALSGKAKRNAENPSVAVAEEILPGDLLSGKIIAAVTKRGAYHAHASVLARSMGIPFLLCPDLDVSRLSEGGTVIVDGEAGVFITNPDDKALSRADEKRKAGADGEEVDFSRLPVKLCVNISSPADADADLLSKIDGIGLYRTEFLYIGRDDLPDEEEQTEAYAAVLRAAKGKRVVIRTFDLGADKVAKALTVPKEENPALGMRGIRLALTRPEVFRVQLRALLRAAVEGDLWVMYPMITSAEEIRAAKRAVADAAQSLEQEGIPYRVPRQGIMIETPAAAVLSDELAKKADFFSVGTNDLTQYTLALDRQNGELERFSDPENRAVLRLVGIAAKNAKAAGIPIGVCGDLASDPETAPKLVSLGVDSLSTAPALIRKVAGAVMTHEA